MVVQKATFDGLNDSAKVWELALLVTNPVLGTQDDQLILTDRWFHLFVVTRLDWFELLSVKVAFVGQHIPHGILCLRTSDQCFP